MLWPLTSNIAYFVPQKYRCMYFSKLRGKNYYGKNYSTPVKLPIIVTIIIKKQARQFREYYNLIILQSTVYLYTRSPSGLCLYIIKNRNPLSAS